MDTILCGRSGLYPSRATLLTGRYPIRSGKTSSERPVIFPDSANGLPLEERSTAELLKPRNYATAAKGKWYLGHLPKFLLQQPGFDYYYAIPYSIDLSRVLTQKSPSTRKDLYYWAFAELHAYRNEQYKIHIRQREAIDNGRSYLVLERPELYDPES